MGLPPVFRQLKFFDDLKTRHSCYLIPAEPVGQGGAVVNLQFDAFQRQDAEQMRQKLIVAYKRGASRCFVSIAEGESLDSAARRLGGLEEFSMEA